MEWSPWNSPSPSLISSLKYQEKGRKEKEKREERRKGRRRGNKSGRGDEGNRSSKWSGCCGLSPFFFFFVIFSATDTHCTLFPPSLCFFFFLRVSVVTAVATYILAICTKTNILEDIVSVLIPVCISRSFKPWSLSYLSQCHRQKQIMNIWLSIRAS